ncbi:Uncharacterised protein [Streptococcus pneumoniae]|nr:Uncharacterised protein [Streptococcus pneumoniae]
MLNPYQMIVIHSFLGTFAPVHLLVKGSEDVLPFLSIRTAYYGLPFY